MVLLSSQLLSYIYIYIVASYCLSRVDTVKEIEKPLPLATSPKASNQWPHRSEVLHPVPSFRAVSVPGWPLVSGMFRTCRRELCAVQAIGGRAALLSPGSPQTG